MALRKQQILRWPKTFAQYCRSVLSCTHTVLISPLYSVSSLLFFNVIGVFSLQPVSEVGHFSSSLPSHSCPFLRSASALSRAAAGRAAESESLVAGLFASTVGQVCVCLLAVTRKFKKHFG